MKFPQITRRRFLGLAAGSAAVLAADAFWFDRTWVRTRFVKLPGAAGTHRLVHLSDIHHKGDRAYLESVVRQVNALSPEFVCFTGDLIEDAHYVPEALEILRGLKSPLYGVPGNHDWWSNADFRVISKGFAATGGRWLLNQNIPLAGGAINLIGAVCDHPDFIHPQPGVKNLLLMHYPAWTNNMKGKTFDLLLAGHSHGGQVRIPFFGAPILPNRVGAYDLGLYQTPSGPLYVNPGIGYYRLPVRFNCPPEITVLEV